jgi:protein TonB
MATPSASGFVPERRRFYPAAALALLAEALLLGGGYLMLAHKPAPPAVPPVTMLSIAPAPETAPAPEAPPVPKPQPVARPVTPVHQVTHVARPHSVPAVPPPAPTPIPEPATPSAAPMDTRPASTPPPPPAMPAAAPAAPNPSFENAMRAAIQAALHYPESARMAGMAGRARVSFRYRDGSVSDVTLITSSGGAILDRAALAAVRDAAYPKPEPAQMGKTLDEQLWVTFNLNDNE